VSLFVVLITVPLSLFSSPPLLDVEDMLLGPVGFRVGTPPKAPDITRDDDLGDSYPPALYGRSGVRCSWFRGLGFWSLPVRILGGICGAMGSFGGLAGGWFKDAPSEYRPSEIGGDMLPESLVPPLYRLVWGTGRRFKEVCDQFALAGDMGASKLWA